MKAHFRISFAGLLFLSLLALSCSNRKNTGMSRFWHRLNTRFNGHFNGKEALKEGMLQLSQTKKENYNRILPVFDYGAPEGWGPMLPMAERAIEKGAKMIRKHSMLINGKQHNSWIDDCYLIMGKGNYFKRDVFLASGQLRYVARESEKEATRQEAAFWLFKLYVVAGEFADASTAMRQVNLTTLHPKLQPEFHAVTAEYFIRQKRYEEALEPLKKAFETTKKKRMKARYAFIMGQLYEALDQKQAAYTQFKTVLTLKPVYEMEFQTRMKLARSAENADVASLRKQFKKMLRDEKNIDYLDQIYYALALLDLSEGKRKQALANLELSARNNKDNKEQKALTFQKMAELNLEDEKYELAQAYYDTTAQDLTKDYPDYDQVIRLRDNLTAVVEQIRILRLNDSLVMLAAMDTSALRAKFTAYVEELKAADQKAEEAALNAPAGSISPESKGAWYWVNEQARTLGRAEFKKVWGDRPNEDHWRRSKKASVGGSDAPEASTDSVKANPRYDINRYLKDVPTTPEAVAQCKKKAEDALYALGIIYRDKIKNLKRSNEAFLALEQRNTKCEHFPLAYYQLYLNYNALKDEAQAQKYRDKIIAEFPQSDYAQMLTDPGFLRRKEEASNKAAPAYRQAYAKYEARQFSEARILASAGLRDYPESPLAHRFALLEALAVKETDSIPVFKVKLKEVAAKYAKTESGETARRLLTLLGEKVEAPVQETTAPKDSTSTAPPKPKKEYPYKFDEKAEHMVMLIVFDAVYNPEKLKGFIGNFNEMSYASNRLTVSNTLLGNKLQMLNIRRFTTAKDAMVYIQALQGAGLKDQASGVTLKPFAISLANLALVFKDKNVELYEEWYKENYK